MSGGARAAAILLACTAAGCAGGPTLDVAAAQRAAAEVRCPGIRVSVLAASKADTAQICAGARDAIGFLAEQGFDVTAEVTIEVVAQLPEKVAASAVGCFVPSSKRVYLLGYADFARSEDWFGVPVEPALYRSLAAHEVAHAVTGCNFKVERPSAQAWEYVAYVAMLSTMAPELRRRVLERYPGEGFETDAHINANVYYMDPAYFAVVAYRHFLRPGNGRAYLHAILAGKVLVD